MGLGSVDMRNASFAEQTVRITVFALMGGIDIVVPEDAEVHAHGLGIMGGFGGHRVTSPGQAGAPVIIVTALAIMGGIGIRRAAAEEGVTQATASLSGLLGDQDWGCPASMSARAHLCRGVSSLDWSARHRIR
jgi:hypothetical protein